MGEGATTTTTIISMVGRGGWESVIPVVESGSLRSRSKDAHDTSCYGEKDEGRCNNWAKLPKISSLGAQTWTRKKRVTVSLYFRRPRPPFSTALLHQQTLPLRVLCYT